MAVSCSWSSLITTSLTTLYSLVTISLFKPTTLINLSVFIKKKNLPTFRCNHPLIGKYDQAVGNIRYFYVIFVSASHISDESYI